MSKKQKTSSEIWSQTFFLVSKRNEVLDVVSNLDFLRKQLNSQNESETERSHVGPKKSLAAIDFVCHISLCVLKS